MDYKIGGIYHPTANSENYYVIVRTDKQHAYLYKMEYFGEFCSNNQINSMIDENRSYGFCNLDDFRCIDFALIEYVLAGYLGTLTNTNLQYLLECFKETTWYNN